MSPTIVPSSSPSTGEAVAETVLETILYGDCSLEEMDDSQLEVFEKTMKDIIESSNQNLTSVNVTVTDQQLNKTGCNSVGRMLVSGRQLETTGSGVITLISTFILIGFEFVVEKAIENLVDLLNVPLNLVKVENSLEVSASINVTTCKVTDLGQLSSSCTRDTTAPSVNVEPSLAPSLEPTFSPTLFHDTNSTNSSSLEPSLSPSSVTLLSPSSVPLLSPSSVPSLGTSSVPSDGTDDGPPLGTSSVPSDGTDDGPPLGTSSIP